LIPKGKFRDAVDADTFLETLYNRSIGQRIKKNMIHFRDHHPRSRTLVCI